MRKQIGHSLIKALRERNYARRRRIAGYAIHPKNHRAFIRQGLTSQQLYFLGIAARRTLWAEILRNQAIAAATLPLPILALSALLSITLQGARVPLQEFLSMAAYPGILAIFSTLASLILQATENARRNRGGALGALALRAVGRLDRLSSYESSYSGLAPGGSKDKILVRKLRREIRENCWRMTLWSADTAGRPRSDYALESVSSFPRILLWAMDNPDLRNIRLAHRRLIDFINMIDNNHLDFKFQEASDTARQVPEMKKPSIPTRLRRALSVTKVSATVAIFAGTATILTFFKVPETIFLP